MKKQSFKSLLLVSTLLFCSHIQTWANTTVWHDTVSYENMPIETIELSSIDSLTARIFALSSDVNNSDAIKIEFDRIIDLCSKISTAKSLAYIEFYKDVTQTSFKELNNENDYKLTLAQNKIIYMIGYLTYTPCVNVVNDYFLKLFPDGDIPPITVATATSDTLKTLLAIETALKDDYYEGIASGFPIDVNGQQMTLSEIKSSSLSVSDKNSAINAWRIERNRVLGTIYLELAKNRVLQAKTPDRQSSDSYVDYAYTYDRMRSYKSDDILAIRKYIIEKISPYLTPVNKKYTEAAAIAKPLDSNPEIMLEALSDAITTNFDALEPSFNYLKEYQLYDIGEETNRMNAGFCTDLLQYNASYIFLTNSPTDSRWNYQGLFHEFGHFFDAYTDIRERKLLFYRNCDLGETMSTGLELMSYHLLQSGSWSKNQLEAYNLFNIQKIISGAILNGFIIDDFERQIYSNPNITLDSANNLFELTQKKYLGDNSQFSYNKYDWVRTTHIYETPFYYISYAMSALPALEMWATAYNDRPKAIEMYTSVANQGSFGDYNKTLKNANLQSPFSEEIYTTITSALDKLLATDVSVDDNNLASKVKVYPNPFSDQFRVDMSLITESHSMVDYKLIDASGREVKTGKITSENRVINLKGHSSGIYLLLISTNGVLLENITLIKE